MGSNVAKYESAIAKCTIKYTAVWERLQGKANLAGTICDGPRLVDNGPTVTDNLTGLQWEKKTDDDTVHDKDSVYSWSTDAQAANGDVYTTFLAMLNSGGCLAGQCDWRLPTFAELQTIVFEPYPCATSPCVDPIFEPMVPYFYASATTLARIPPYTEDLQLWGVQFHDGSVEHFTTISFYPVRAVRGGL